MGARERKFAMLVPTIIMGVLAVILLLVGYARGEGEEIRGLKAGGKMMVEIVPLLAFAFVAAGMVQVLLPRESLARWVGQESGMRGIFVGTIAGGLSPGGPYVALPIVAGLLRTGRVLARWLLSLQDGRFGRWRGCRWRWGYWDGGLLRSGLRALFSSRRWRGL